MADRATLSPPLRKHLDDGATDERAARVWAAIQRRRRGQHVSRRFWIGTVAVAGAAALVVLVRGGAAPPVALPGPLRAAGGDRIAEPLPERSLLSDGLEIALGAGSTLDVVDNTGRAFVTRLRAGRGTFDVRPGGPRRWTIEAGLATIEVVGTRFTVQRSAREVRVDVARGAVLVHADGLSGRVQRLTAGQSIRIRGAGAGRRPAGFARAARVAGRRAGARSCAGATAASPVAGRVAGGGRSAPSCTRLAWRGGHPQSGSGCPPDRCARCLGVIHPGQSPAGRLGATGRRRARLRPLPGARPNHSPRRGRAGAPGRGRSEGRTRRPRPSSRRGLPAPLSPRPVLREREALVRPALIAVLVGGGLCLRAPALGAAQPPPDVVDLQIRGCDAPAFSVRDLYQAVTLELMLDGARRVTQASGPATGRQDLSVDIVCAADLQATVVLAAPRGTLALSRHVPLAEIEARDWPRVLALAVADWLRVAWPQVAESNVAGEGGARSNPPSVPAPATAAATVAAHSPEPGHGPAGPASAVSVWAAARARWFATQRTLAWGGSAGLDLGRAALQVEALTSRRETALGTASVGLAAVGISYRLWQRQTAATHLSFGPGVALGFTWASAEGARDSVMVRADGGLYADARLALAGAVAVTPLVWLTASLDGGRAAGLSELAGAEAAGATGGWFGGAAVGAGF